MVPRRAIPVEYSDRQTLAFEGRGAAAGIMLDSLLGGTGVAIGIAIDEGIAKDIATNIQAKYPDYSFEREFGKVLSSSRRSNLKLFTGLTQVIINRYGFHTFAGDGDKVNAWVAVDFICNNQSIVGEFPGEDKNPDAIDFTAIKIQADQTVALLNKASENLIDQWLANGGCGHS